MEKLTMEDLPKEPNTIEFEFTLDDLEKIRED